MCLHKFSYKFLASLSVFFLGLVAALQRSQRPQTETYIRDIRVTGSQVFSTRIYGCLDQLVFSQEKFDSCALDIKLLWLVFGTKS